MRTNNRTRGSATTSSEQLLHLRTRSRVKRQRQCRGRFRAVVDGAQYASDLRVFSAGGDYS